MKRADVVRFALWSGGSGLIVALLAVASVRRPDNSSWSKEGRLLVASHVGSASENFACTRIESGSCPMPFEIVSLDPLTLEGEAVFANAGPPMGAGTVAVDLGDSWMIGSFAGDRLIRVPKPSTKAKAE